MPAQDSNDVGFAFERSAGTSAGSSPLRRIVATLGGELYDGGRRALVPAPGHSPADRSVSLLLSGGRVVVHSFGAADWRAVLDDLRARGLVDAAGAPLGGSRPPGRREPPALSDRARIDAALWLWSEGAPLRDGVPAGQHCRRRGVTGDLARFEALRSHPAAPLAVYRRGRRRQAALLAAVRDMDGELTAVEVTYLDSTGQRDRRLEVSRKIVGRLPAGAAVRLAEPHSDLLVAEGVFTTLSAMARFHRPGWALLSAGSLGRWTPPAGVRRVLIAADRGAAGEAAAAALASRLRRPGLAVVVRLPPWPHGDWNDAAEACGEGK